VPPAPLPPAPPVAPASGLPPSSAALAPAPLLVGFSSAPDVHASTAIIADRQQYANAHLNVRVLWPAVVTRHTSA